MELSDKQVAIFRSCLRLMGTTEGTLDGLHAVGHDETEVLPTDTEVTELMGMLMDEARAFKAIVLLCNELEDAKVPNTQIAYKVTETARKIAQTTNGNGMEAQVSFLVGAMGVAEAETYLRNLIEAQGR